MASLDNLKGTEIERERELIKYTMLHKIFVRLSDKTGQGKGMVRAWLPNRNKTSKVLSN